MDADLLTLKKSLAGQKAVDQLLKDGGFSTPALGVLLSSDCTADEKTKCEMAELLLAAGARPDALDAQAKCALYLHSCSAALMKLFRAASPAPNVNVRTSGGDN